MVRSHFVARGRSAQGEQADVACSAGTKGAHSAGLVAAVQCALEHLLGLADLEVDLVRRRATRAGQRLDLTAKEFTLLTLLLRRQGEVLSRTEIAEQVWDMNFDSATNVIDVAVKRLRGKLDAPFERTLLHTARGMGYVLEVRDE